jgi:hypothetical protein
MPESPQLDLQPGSAVVIILMLDQRLSSLQVANWRSQSHPLRWLAKYDGLLLALRDLFGTTCGAVCKPSYRLALVVLRFLFVSICIALKGIDDVHRTCSST